MIGGLILAAGEGRRFGGPKQLAELRGRPLLEYSIEAIEASPAIERIVVVLGAHAELISERVDLADVETVVAGDWREGISASLRTGFEALADAEAVVVTLADQPLITSQGIGTVLGYVARPEPAARATYGGVPGHPVLIKRSLFAEVATLHGDVGARDLLERVGAATVECGAPVSAHDIDTVEDLERIGNRTAASAQMARRSPGS